MWYIVAGVVIFFFVMYVLEKNKVVTDEDELEPSTAENGELLDPESEADRVHRMVNERIQSAEKKGIRELVEELYLKKFKQNPIWTGKTNKQLHATRDPMREAEQTGQNKRLEDDVLEFRFRETGDFDGTNYGELELFWNKNSVMQLDMAINWDDGDEYVSAEWHSFSIKAYIPGEWENILQSIKQDLETSSNEQKKREREDPRKLEDLKKKFGL